MDLLALLLALIVGAGAGYGFARARPRREDDAAGDVVGDVAGEGGGAPGDGAGEEPWRARLRELVRELEPVYEAADHPARMAEEPLFQSAAGLVASRAPDAGDVAGLLTGHDPIVGCIGGEALGARSDVEAVADAFLAGLADVRPWTMFYALPHLAEVDAPATGALVLRAPQWWTDIPGQIDAVGRFAERRVERGEQPSFGGGLDDLDPERAEEVEELLGKLDRPALAPLVRELRAWRAERTDRTFLATVGKLWGEARPESPLMSTPALDAERDAVVELLRREPPRSVLLVGDAGVGKSSLVRAVASEMVGAGWTVLEADGTSLLADQVYIGSLEGRVRKLLENLDLRRRVLWYAPAFHELLVAGRHSQSPVTGVLDMVLPAIEQGRIVVLGEIRSAAFERLIAVRPQLASALGVVRLVATDAAATLALGEQWAALSAADGEPPIADRALIEEALELADNLLVETAAPGNLLTLLELTRRHRRARDLPPPLTLDDLLESLSALSGLPRGVLDDRQRLDLSAVRARFTAAVVGQTEAVDCLVDRIAMIKAGLTDPGRPLGVFLLVGPTGTGKTELAKTLARFLFGSAERMVRLDMSEFQGSESLDRVIGDTRELAGPASLASAVRRQPFAVVLLDEFEKAHRQVWDLFLQVFDDGRLTDRLGNTADFRHTIILLTSNLGAAIGGAAPIGFVGNGSAFSPSAVQRAVADTFRPEFLNRLDRVIVFEPLSRSVMREILGKELRAALARRGLRTREWAVEWEASVIDFLLERGFTAKLGARPLRRAIERHVLGPLSATIVEHRFPGGDQFLFLRSDGKAVQAEFVDPDAPEPAPPSEEPGHAPAPGGPSLGEIALAAHGTSDELALLESIYARLLAGTGSERWRERKRRALEATRDPEFWDSEGRAEILGDVELLDRIEAALGSAGSLARRLRGDHRAARARFPAAMLARLAAQLHVVQAACRAVAEDRPQDAVLAVEAFVNPHQPRGANEAFARRLVAMYRRWARHRRMHLVDLDPARAGEAAVAAFAVSGLGAYLLLEPEAGLHVLDEPSDSRGDSRGGTRVRARVRVGPMTEVPEPSRPLFGSGEPSPAIVRHYRDAPSPLVRDRVRGWRTGRIDRVMDGDFDLLG